ncbi:MAG: 4-hydroxy-3-methylbut-2-enyl diphosphate reductase [Hyphomicrobiales bacterium]|nr:4-hydroxy-3-methylbut-2-enyl diphosphate reductase [Hyphomicrobiales bacterium]
MTETTAKKPPLKLFLCAPRGFCAGVDRAIEIVELALEKYGAPVYVRHEIVHNRYVVESLARKGAVFVDELDEIPDTDAPVIFSAHGVARAVTEAAKARNLFAIDATCPLVTKVHVEGRHHHDRGNEIVLVGHADHPEVVGTMGQLPRGAATLVETVADARAFEPKDPARLAYLTQTTLSVDDTAEIVAVPTERFPALLTAPQDDICYATPNRQEAVTRIAPRCDAMIVVGAPNSSNSQRLKEVAARAGCRKAMLIQRAQDIDWAEMQGIGSVGITAGASAPEILVTELVEAFRQRFDVEVETAKAVEERVRFNLPRELRPVPAA